MTTPTMQDSLKHLLTLAKIPLDAAANVEITGSDPVFPTRYRAVTPGAAAIAAAGLAASRLWALKTGRQQQVRLSAEAAAAALRSTRYLKINGEKPPEDPTNLTGFYPLKDQRWMYLHCNFFNLRDQNVNVLGCAPTRESVAAAVAQREGLALEAALVAHGGVGSLVRSEAEWLALPQSQAVAQLPVLEITKIGDAPPRPLPPGPRPLSGVRVLDLTRVLAGPVCARTLAEHGADVLRVTREDLADFGYSDFDTNIGKLATHIDLRQPEQAAIMRKLISTCDVFSQSYRPGTLARRGLSPQALAEMRPGIVYVTLNAWGHEGPWHERRGYDTVVQSANGFAWQGEGKPPAFMPYAAQDYVVGYLLAFGALVALERRATEGGSWMVRTSLASAGHWIRQHGLMQPADYAHLPTEFNAEQLQSLIMQHDSPRGRVTHLAPAVHLSETPTHWTRPAVARGSHAAEWPEREG